jgi:dihydropteroate synthase
VGEEISRCLSESGRVMSWGGRTLDFSRKTYVMGILNCTPDSFYPGSRSATIGEATQACAAMLSAGVDIVDVGGESTRPGSDPVSAREEARRVVPVVRALRRLSNVIISVDTRRKEVAERALDAGADMINDVSGLKFDRRMAALAARRAVPVVVMHMRGTPKTMQEEPRYADTMGEICRELDESVSIALEAGIPRGMIIVDPGIGFAKRASDNLRIIRELASLKSLGFPILIGISRKSFIGQILKRPVEDRLTGTVAANTLAVINGADIVRVHDVEDAVDMVKIIDSVRRIGA